MGLRSVGPCFLGGPLTTKRYSATVSSSTRQPKTWPILCWAQEPPHSRSSLQVRVTSGKSSIQSSTLGSYPHLNVSEKHSPNTLHQLRNFTSGHRIQSELIRSSVWSYRLETDDWFGLVWFRQWLGKIRLSRLRQLFDRSAVPAIFLLLREAFKKPLNLWPRHTYPWSPPPPPI